MLRRPNIRRQTNRTVFFLAALIACSAGSALASTHTWTGATSTSWSDNSNWIGGSPAGDPSADLVFPASPQRLQSTDDINGVSFINSITIVGSGYNLDAFVGSSIALAGGLTWNGNNSVITGANFFAIPIALYGGSTHYFLTNSPADATAKFYFSGLIGGGASETLTFWGFAGPPATFVLTRDNTFSGPTNILGTIGGCANLTINGQQPASAVTDFGGCVLSGSGQIGPLHLDSHVGAFMAATVQPGDTTTGTLSVNGDVTVTGALSSRIKARINGPNVGVDYDQLSVDGNINLSLAAWIDISLGFQPTIGQVFTIVKSTGQITPQSQSNLSVGCTNFRVDYTQHEVTLTSVAPSPPPPITNVTIQAVGTRTICPASLGGVASVADTGGGGTCNPDAHQWGYRLTFGGAVSNITGQTGTTYTINGADFLGIGTYFLVCTSTPTGGASVTSNEIPVTVTPPPTALASGGGTICAGTFVQLSGSGGSSCSWLPSVGLSDPNSCAPFASPTSSTVYSLTVSGASGCVSTNTATASVVVKPIPSVPVVQAPATVGAGAINQSASVDLHPGSNYQWGISNGTITAGGNANSILFTAGITGTPLVLSVVEESNGCVSPPAISVITVLNLPIVTSFAPVIPCRVLDTRIRPSAPLAGPTLQPGATRVFPIPSAPCGIPTDARTVSANMTVTNPTQPGSLTLYPADVAVPATTSISFRAGQTRANNVMLKLSADGTASFSVTTYSTGTVDFILDVNGYLT